MRWVYGAEGRNSKVKFINGDVALTGPERLAHIDWLRNELKAAEERLAIGLGNGNNIDSKHLAELRMDLITSESDLAKDANSFVAELKKEPDRQSGRGSSKSFHGTDIRPGDNVVPRRGGSFFDGWFFNALIVLDGRGFLDHDLSGSSTFSLVSSAAQYRRQPAFHQQEYHRMRGLARSRVHADRPLDGTRRTGPASVLPL